MSYNGHEPERFIIKFIGACDIPSDFGGKSDPFLQAYISEHVVHFDQENRKYFKLQRISNVITTPKRLDCSSVIWNCYRDFKINPPVDSVLIIDIYTSNDVADDRILGTVSIPVKVFSDEAPKIFNFVAGKVCDDFSALFAAFLILYRHKFYIGSSKAEVSKFFNHTLSGIHVICPTN